MHFLGSGRILAAMGIVALGTGVAFAKGGTAKPPPTPPATVNVLPAPGPAFIPQAPSPDINVKQFDITGFVQDMSSAGATCPATGAGDVLVNGIWVQIPCNLIVQMPAQSLTWDQFVSSTPAAYDLARGTTTNPNPSFELHLVGNIKNGKHIAGLAYASQQSLSSGSGIIKSIDLATGLIMVETTGKTTGAKTVALEINDPAQRFGRPPALGLDGRLAVDDANPTISAASGYPMCVPRSASDADCPVYNRPAASGAGSLYGGCRTFANAGIATTPNPAASTFFTGATGVPGANGGAVPSSPGMFYCTSFVMKAAPGYPAAPYTVGGSTFNYPTGANAALPTAQIAVATQEPDATKQAPLVVGDFITWNGSLVRGTPAGPSSLDVISVYSIVANVGIYTQPRTLPVYTRIGEFGIAGDTAVTTASGVSQEVQNRFIIEADVTDVTAIVDAYIVDTDTNGRVIHRWVTPGSMSGRGANGADLIKTGGLIGFAGLATARLPTPAGYELDGGITTQWDGAQIGRARIRANKATPGLLTSPARTVRVVVRTLCGPQNINNAALVPNSLTPVASGGLGWTAENLTATNVTGVTTGGTCITRATSANGLSTGQYEAPVFEYIFPENTGKGDPIVPNNFWDYNFLVNGDATAGGLSPKPY